MQDAPAGGRGSGTVTPAGAAPGEMEAGLQMDEAVVPKEAGAAPAATAAPEEAELEEEEEAEELEAAAGGVNCPLLSEPELSRAGDDFFLAGRLLAPPPLCCCCRHLARRFLNQTWGKRGYERQGEEPGALLALLQPGGLTRTHTPPLHPRSPARTPTASPQMPSARSGASCPVVLGSLGLEAKGAHRAQDPSTNDRGERASTRTPTLQAALRGCCCAARQDRGC